MDAYSEASDRDGGDATSGDAFMDGGQDSPRDEGDAEASSIGADSDADSGDASVHCSAMQPFGPPQLVPGLNDASGSVVSARFSPDELTAYLGMFHGNNVDIYQATRQSPDQPFGPPTPFSTLGSPGEDDFASVTADGLSLYMQSTRSGKYGLYTSSRTSIADAFSTPAEITSLDVYGEGHPYVMPDGSALYFHSYRTGNFDIFRAEISGGSFGTAEPLGIDTSGDESSPAVSADELTIYFIRSGNSGPEVWMATRASTSEAFAHPIALPDLSNPYQTQAPTWISPDDCRLYLQEQDQTGGYRVYVAARMPVAAMSQQAQ